MGVGTAIQRHWDRVDAITVLLMPLSLLYGLVVRARAIAYRIGVFKIRQWNVPVLVVGNLTVGGSGKTPLVIKLAQALQARGWRPGVVSRGYGGRVRAATV
ncbi:MAG TPA: tetraacyldisaccharide 4'-kinase, partial [Arenicellales bacterium]|nr:tetraacyldisaccharide 4'-kinase [Arenicellales bacterium]